MSDANWSDDRVQTLAKLWADGLSASQVAKQLGGVTRNAVIGKIHRLGLSGRAAPARPSPAPRTPRPVTPRPARVSAPLRPPRPAAVAAPPVAPPEGPGLITSMATLGAHACKWPIGDPKSADFSFCGRLTNGVYCRAHADLAYRPGSASPLERDPLVRRVLAGLAA